MIASVLWANPVNLTGMQYEDITFSIFVLIFGSGAIILSVVQKILNKALSKWGLGLGIASFVLPPVVLVVRALLRSAFS